MVNGLLLTFDKGYIDGFFEKVIFSSDDSCWEWNGAKSGNGYGVYGKPANYAHRISYVLRYGKLPMNFFVCHKCDNPSCVNPEHLFLGTHSDNMKDRNSKGRSNLPFGSKSRKSKLFETDIVEIRLAYFDRLFNQYELANLYNVTVSTINSIVNRRGWKHVR